MNQFDIDKDNELQEQLKAGSEQAFAMLFDKFRGTVYGVAFKFLKSSVLAEEIVQDVFLKVWMKRSEMGAVRDFKAYLFIMTRNFIFDRIKKMSYENAMAAELKNEPSHIDDTEYLVRSHECQQLLQQATELLPPQQKQVYYMAKEEGMSHEKIAGIMNLSKLTVKAHMAKALQNIRKYLDAYLKNSLPLLPLLIKSLF